MGGGLKECNCAHETEFNFSKSPQAVKKILASDVPVTLFPLDLTNHQRITEDPICELERDGALKEMIALLRWNRQANMEYNNIPAAVLHDAMPILYLSKPEKFRVDTVRISSDRYGHIEQTDNGRSVSLAMAVEDNVLYEALKEAIIF